MKNRTKLTTILLLSGFLFSCSQQASREIREKITLEGDWILRLDSIDAGTIYLPGTTDLVEKGTFNTDHSETTSLTRNYPFVGKAWYKKSVTIPDGWKGKTITLFLERTKPTHIWIDGQPAGSNDNISVPQVYDLSTFLTPGEHELSILVDNGESVPPQIITSSHAYTESTQTNWNGIIGELYLEACEPVHITGLQIYPDATEKKVTVKLSLSGAELPAAGSRLELSARSWNSHQKYTAKTLQYSLEKGCTEYSFEYPLGEKALLWSEFDPALYKLEVYIPGHDFQSVDFGLRDFRTEGTQFTINGNKTFLRGKHDACVFPLTAHVPMDVDSWRRYFRICKEYGINHCRFHSWCPPKACFEAADIEGIYLQPELPFWGSLQKEDERLTSFLKKEGIHIQNTYGNHASFVMFALGNELSGDPEVMEELTQAFRNTDSRHLYAFGSNNYLGFKGELPGEDFLVTCRIGGAPEKSFATHTRGSFSFADAWDGGYINHCYPNLNLDFSGPVDSCSIPVISHETGQFQVYPDYKERDKYTGALRPDNFEIFRKRLENTGMQDQADDFFKASGRWSALLYKADIEMCLRTAGLAGFQLLDLQDYPGQGSAYVGMLDAFMDSKGLITPEEWREFCSEVVPLFVTEKFCWTNKEKLTGEIKVTNYSPASLWGQKVSWVLKNREEQTIDRGEVTISSAEQGLLSTGQIHPDITSINRAEELTLVLSLPCTTYQNSYPLWIYPEENDISTEGIHITRSLTSAAMQELRNGGKVLWFPEQKGIEKLTVGALFQTDYWNYRMFKTICESIGKPVSPGTMGILTNPEHPLFHDFPTDYHTNWQWFPVIKESYPFILDRMPADYRPIVQVIDNIERNHKLGLIFELGIDKGKLLICMSDIPAVMDKPEARQLYNSMIGYMQSGAFAPSVQIDIATLNDLFTKEVKVGKIETLRNISYD